DAAPIAAAPMDAAPMDAAPTPDEQAPAAEPDAAEPDSRKDRVAAQLATILSDLSGMDPAALDPTASFAELGFDSLFLTQANAQFRKQFGVRITFRQIFEEAPSISSLAEFIDGKLPPEALPAPQRPTAAPKPSAAPAPAAAPAVTPSS